MKALAPILAKLLDGRLSPDVAGELSATVTGVGAACCAVGAVFQELGEAIQSLGAAVKLIITPAQVAVVPTRLELLADAADRIETLVQRGALIPLELLHIRTMSAASLAEWFAELHPALKVLQGERRYVFAIARLRDGRSAGRMRRGRDPRGRGQIRFPASAMNAMCAMVLDHGLTIAEAVSRLPATGGPIPAQSTMLKMIRKLQSDSAFLAGSAGEAS